MIRDLYEQLIKSEPMGFINPLEDLGEFDVFQMKFKKPVRLLVNKHSGQPYPLHWQNKIEEMRGLYIQYQLALREEQEIRRVRKTEDKKHIEKIVTTYLSLGFRFSEIENKVQMSNKRLRDLFRRSDYVTTSSPEFFNKEDIQAGYFLPEKHLPSSMRV